MELFVDRAAACSDGFALHDANVGAIVEICRRLDGIPLAIELAAARVAGMGPAEIARRLDERFRLLGGVGRRAQERHRTLLAAVTWSHDLLSEPERRVFRRLAVFPATFDLAAAEAVAVDDELSGLDVVDLVVRLVARSLIQHDPDADRYSLLETLRQYGTDRLGEAGEADRVRRVYAAHYLDLAAAAAPALADRRFAVTHQRLVPEWENFRAVGDWLADQERWSDLADLARRLVLFTLAEQSGQGHRWRRAAIDHGAVPDPGVRVDDLGHMCGELVYLGDWGQAQATMDEAARIVEREGLQPSPTGLQAQGMLRAFQGEHDAAAAAYRQCLARCAGRDDVELQAVWALAGLSASLAATGRIADSQPLAAEALERATRLGHPHGMMVALVCAVQAHVGYAVEPDFEAGADLLAAHPLASANPLPHDAWLLCIRGVALLGAGRPGAREELVAAWRLADRSGSEVAAGMALEALAWACAEAGDLDDSALVRGYAAGLRSHLVRWPLREWIDRRVEVALARLEPAHRREVDLRAATLTRHEVVAIVDRHDRSSGHD